MLTILFQGFKDVMDIGKLIGTAVKGGVDIANEVKSNKKKH